MELVLHPISKHNYLDNRLWALWWDMDNGVSFGPFGITENFTMPRRRAMAAEIRQLLCDLWELPISEQETSGHLSKWKPQVADLKDHEYLIGGDIPGKHLYLPAKPGPLWSTNVTKCALPKMSSLYKSYIFAGWFLSFHRATLSSASVLFLFPTNAFQSKKEGCTPFQSLPGNWKELHSTEQLPIIFIPKPQGGLIPWHLFPRKRGWRES